MNNNNAGTFYIFTNGGQGVQIYDPAANSVVKTLTDVPLGSSTYTPADTKYSANCCGGSPSVPSYGDAVWLKDKTGTKQYAYVSENGAYNRVHVYDVTAQKYVTSIPVGGNKPLHMYAVPFRYEAWTHTDLSSGFDVFSPQNITKPIASSVAEMPHVGLLTGSGYTSGHGKLLWEDELGNLGFETNTYNAGGNFGTLGALDLGLKRRISFINITSSAQAATYCNWGTHGIGYNAPYNSIIAQCLDKACAAPFTSVSGGCTGSNYLIDATRSNWEKPTATR